MSSAPKSFRLIVVKIESEEKSNSRLRNTKTDKRKYNKSHYGKRNKKEPKCNEKLQKTQRFVLHKAS